MNSFKVLRPEGAQAPARVDVCSSTGGAMERAGGSISLGDGARSIQPPSPPRNRPTKTPASQRLTDSAALQATAPSQAAAPSQATAKLGWRLRPVSRSRDALQRVGTSAPIYAALAERLSSLEGASHPGDGFSRRRGPGSAPRPTTAAARPPVAGWGRQPPARPAAPQGVPRGHTPAPLRSLLNEPPVPHERSCSSVSISFSRRSSPLRCS